MIDVQRHPLAHPERALAADGQVGLAMQKKTRECTRTDGRKVGVAMPRAEPVLRALARTRTGNLRFRKSPLCPLSYERMGYGGESDPSTRVTAGSASKATAP